MTTKKLTDSERMLGELEELALALSTLRDVGGDGGAAQIMRNDMILALYNHGVSMTAIARAAGVDRTWPYTLAKTHPGDRAEWRRHHPDLVQLLLNARKRIDFLLKLARSRTEIVDEDEAVLVPDGPGE